MAITGVSTYALFQSTMDDVAKVQNDLNTEQQQLSSGNSSQNFAGIAAQTQQYLSLDNTISRLNQYATDNQVIEARVNATAQSLSQIVTAATNLGNLISQRENGVSSAGFTQQLESYWQQIAGALNTTVSGQYLFSGTKTNVQPVSTSIFPEAGIAGVTPSTYYHGSNQDITVRSDDSTTMVINVRADDPAIQKIYTALALAKTGDADNDNAKLSQAYQSLQDGIQGVITAQATVNANIVSLKSSDSNNNTQKLYLQGLQQSIGNTDIVSVSSQVAINQAILQAAFQAFAKINSLRLSDYLK